MYLLARQLNQQGCIAYETHHGKHLVSLMKKLNKAAAAHGVELLTISRPLAYGEYAPYTIADDEDSFCSMVLKLGADSFSLR